MEKKEYDEIFSKVPRLCIDLVILGQNGFLLGRRAHEPFIGKYAFPGGRLHFGETIKQGLSRIAREELNIRVSALGAARGYIEFPEEISICNKHSISIPILCSISEPRVPELRSSHFTELSYYNLIDKSEILKPILRYIKKEYPLFY